MKPEPRPGADTPLPRSLKGPILEADAQIPGYSMRELKADAPLLRVSVEDARRAVREIVVV